MSGSDLANYMAGGGISAATTGAMIGGTLGVGFGLFVKANATVPSMLKAKDGIMLGVPVLGMLGVVGAPILPNFSGIEGSTFADHVATGLAGAVAGTALGSIIADYNLPILLGTFGAGGGYVIGSIIDGVAGTQRYASEYGWNATAAQLKAGAIGETAGLKFDTIKQHGAQLLASIGKSRTDGMNNLPFADAKEIGSNLVPAITQQASARRF